MKNIRFIKILAFTLIILLLTASSVSAAADTDFDDSRTSVSGNRYGYIPPDGLHLHKPNEKVSLKKILERKQRGKNVNFSSLTSEKMEVIPEKYPESGEALVKYLSENCPPVRNQ